jgi:hypothetical protein
LSLDLIHAIKPKGWILFFVTLLNFATEALSSENHIGRISANLGDIFDGQYDAIP